MARIGEKIDAYKILVGKSERAKPIGRARLGWEDDIKMALRNVVEWHGLELSDAGQ